MAVAIIPTKSAVKEVANEKLMGYLPSGTEPDY
jgi:hypothetical protein